VDAGNNRLLSFNKDGEFLNEFNANGQLQAPFDMVKDREGHIWLIEKGRNSLTMIDLENKAVENHSLSFNGQTVFPERLEQEDDILYVLDKITGQVLALDKDLKVIRNFTCRDGTGFVDFKIRNGSLWAMERDGNMVRFTMDGKPASRVVLEDVVRFPYSLEVGPSGIFYVLDRHGGDVAVFDREGRFRYRFLTLGQARGRLYFPIELKFDPWGRLCVVEEGNGRVEIFKR
jgi:streptogramin lyase